MRLANPQLCWLLLFNLMIGYFWWRRKSRSVVMPDLSRLRMAGLPINLRRRLHQWAVVLRIIAFSCLVIALARPQSLASVEQIKTEVIDIIVTLDISLSMGAQDFASATRLAVAKDIIEEFIDGREADRLGLITFAAYSQLRSPLTLDYEILKLQLADIELVDRNDQEANGTAIGIALASSVNHLRRSDAKSRVVILLTDGDNNVSTIEPNTAAQLAQVMGIKVYTVGVGTTGMVRMPSTNPNDPPDTYIMQKSSFNEDTLKEIASLTGGNYYRATDRESLATIFKEIDKLERTPVNVLRYDRYKEEFFPWVVGAIIFLLLDLTLQHTYLRVLP